MAAGCGNADTAYLFTQVSRDADEQLWFVWANIDLPKKLKLRDFGSADHKNDSGLRPTVSKHVTQNCAQSAILSAVHARIKAWISEGGADDEDY